jgi:hypothetical protein
MQQSWSWSVERIAEAIRAFYEATGEWPLSVDFCAANGLPAQATVERYFDTLAAARRQAGMPGGGCERVWPSEPTRRAVQD